ncbi:ACP S-malonyltransferase [Mesotoga sp. Brook.08.YT.4.2.5.1]|uniref:Malonyl CoA-acyl carrier protein transacylase n=1 Tax=Mesotoga prima TaxID=1184387 RepID=A0A117M2S0_9BACT|nr:MULTISPECIES: ACP S-malonyltransferase [unclassified Mesotoga]KUK81144.1 MAG: Malonyl CoA-acyl carrier protein transacylase [Mesotoga prima]RAM58901.1 ACP S-malonyltransferase [Mesotoga sp. SC_4PWL113PWK15]RAM60749.1 ACP S-malonyltransferase [Mesotoga sp. SC_4PWA21]PNE23175.1 ACP S-malonyltransferase [Mesotoga sp. Brook.08.YT.4.2.5.1]PNS42261.1 ACP S-malonyltransferase [Mesotoga sp. B105.6.4]
MVAWIFPGQGSQYVGMGKTLFEESAIIREFIGLSGRMLGFDMLRLMLEGPESELTLTQNAQPAILSVSIALSDFLSERGAKPDIVAGLSLGEFSALTVAGSLEYADALRLVRLRGIAMQEAIPPGEGIMAAIIGLPNEAVEKICLEISSEEEVIVANYNCPGQVVVSGTTEKVRLVTSMALEAGARKCVELSVSAPFHSRFLQPVGDVLRDFLKDVKVSPPKIPVISNVTGDFFPEDPEEIKELIISQAYKPVKWEQSIRRMIQLGSDRFIEVGPGKVLSGFMKKIDRNVSISTTDCESLEVIREFQEIVN